MKRAASLAAVILLFLIATSPADSQTVYKAYFPLAPSQTFPACERNGFLGIAWLNRTGPSAQPYLDRYCAAMYYNNSGGTYIDIDPDEVPLIWCDRPQDYAKMGTIPPWWNGFLILLNEPGTPGQCTISDPLVAAAVYDEMKDLAPAGAKFVSPNIIIQHQGTGVHGTGWLKSFLNEVVSLRGSCDLFAVGIHFYGATAFTPATKLGWAKTAVDQTGCAGKPIIITEYGSHPGENTFQLISDITYLNNDARVIASFGYTPINAASAIPFEVTNPMLGIQMTDAGRGLFDGYRRLGLLD